jgi:hypothetical protein
VASEWKKYRRRPGIAAARECVENRAYTDPGPDGLRPVEPEPRDAFPDTEPTPTQPAPEPVAEPKPQEAEQEPPVGQVRRVDGEWVLRTSQYGEETLTEYEVLHRGVEVRKLRARIVELEARAVTPSRQMALKFLEIVEDYGGGKRDGEGRIVVDVDDVLEAFIRISAALRGEEVDRGD